MKQRVLSLAAVVTLLACGQDGRNAPTSRPAATATVPALVSTVGVESSDQVDLHADQRVAASDACGEQAMRQLVMRAKGSTLSVYGTLNMKSCVGQPATNGDELGTAAPGSDEQRVAIAMTCEGVDLSAWDGKTYGDLVEANEHPCANATGAHVFTQMGELGKALPATLRGN